MFNDKMLITVLGGLSYYCIHNHMKDKIMNEITMWCQERLQNEIFMSVSDLLFSFCSMPEGGEEAGIPGSSLTYPEW